MDEIRLLSPSSRRIWSPRADDPKAEFTEACLRRAGWTDYRGPGRADDRGWIIKSTDPAWEHLTMHTLEGYGRPRPRPGA
jgi:hypothetical protein